MKRETASLSMSRRLLHAVAVTAVWLLSTVVCYASMIKLAAIHVFQQDLVNHSIVPSALIVPASWAASILELSCGAACLWSLLGASRWRPAAVAGLAMMFGVLAAYAWLAGSMGTPPGCGCGLPPGLGVEWAEIATRNALLALLLVMTSLILRGTR